MQEQAPPEVNSLKARLVGKPLPVDQILEVGCQIADALTAVHASGAVHGNLKPVNILMTAGGQATLRDSGEPSMNYMSPELVRGEALDARADLFSLGVTLYEMATGRQAFGGQTAEAVRDAILHRDPVPIREVNPALSSELDHVITRALEKDRAMRYQTATDIRSELTRLRGDSSATVTALPPVKQKSSALLFVLPVLALLAAGGYYFWRSSQPLDFTERDTIVIADFDNTTGDPVFDDGMRQVASVQFQQSPFVTLLADQSVQRHLRIMSRNPEEPLTGETAREVCKRAGGKASVEGSIASQGSNYAIAIGVHNCQTGEVLTTEQVRASSKADVIPQIGAIATLRKRLGEPAESIEKYNVTATEATSASLEALKAYGQGLRIRQTRGDEASIPLFEQAIQLDPEFALAYARLGVAHSNLGRVEDAKTNTQKAYALRDRVTEYERLYITWSYAQRVTQNMAQARTTMEMMTASYPRDFAVRNNLGVVFMGQGLFEDGLKAYMVAQEIAPDEPLPVSNAAYALMFLARHDEAFAMVDRALALRPDPGLAITRWVVARVHGHPRAAEFEGAARTLATSPQLLFAESNLAVWEGRLKDYSGIVEKLRDEVRAMPDAESALQGLDAAEVITMAVIQDGPWVARLNALAKQSLPPTGLAQVASALAISGQMDTVRALAPELDKADLSQPQQAQPLMVARALLAGSIGQVKEAEAMIDSYLATHPRALDLHYYLGKVREQNGLQDEAIASYQKAAASVNILGPSPAVAGAKLSLALLLKKKGDTSGANALFDELLKQWSSADADFEPLKTVQKNK